MNEKHVVLVVDDDSLIRESMKTLLEVKGLMPLTAASGEEVLSMMEHGTHFAVALIDLMLTGMDGLELVQKIQERDSDANCIVLTGYASAESAIRAVNTGAYAYLVKPCDTEQLALTIQRAAKERFTRKALRESELRYKILFEGASDALYFFDIQSLRFLDVNPSAAQKTGYEREELRNMSLPMLYPPESVTGIAERISLLLENKNIFFETVLTTKNGETFPAEVSCSLIHFQGKTAGLSIARDISERKTMECMREHQKSLLEELVRHQTEELRAANRELERAARMKDEFLASMSHELRTPLNSVLGLSESLLDEVYGPLNEKQRKSLERIGESGQHLLSLINDILDVSKISAGKLCLEKSPVHAESLCKLSLNFIRQTALKKQIRIHENIERNLPAFSADERRMKQVLVNLLSNAVKFTPDGGQIGMEAVKDKDRICFTVWDTGIGIPEDKFGELFVPFVQLDSSLSRAHTGTGLGLTLVDRLTRMHGGTVSLESKQGCGTRFTVSLPLHRPEEPETFAPIATEVKRETVPVPPNPDRIPCILLADDNQHNVEMLKVYMERKGCRVHVAKDGAEVLQRLSEEVPDMLLIDIQMPVMDGIQTIQKIRRDLKLPDLPIAALTALAMPGDREKCMNAGADLYLQKPVILKELVRIIAEKTGCSFPENKKQ